MTDAVPPNALDQRGQKTGLWDEADSHGGLMRGEYLDGERHGHWQHFFVDGTMRSEGGYDHGELTGEWTWFRSGGRVMQRGGFACGEKHGVWERWNADGAPIDAGEFDPVRKSANGPITTLTVRSSAPPPTACPDA